MQPPSAEYQPVEHALKTWPEAFAAIVNGEKRHEFRKNDKNFQTGDKLLLQEFVPCSFCKAVGHVQNPGNGPINVCPKCAGEKGRYTGSAVRVTVLHITRSPSYGMQDGFCCMTIKLRCDKFDSGGRIEE